MRCISFVIFLTFSSCFLALPALENVTQADEIELLERQLEYQTQAATLRMEKLKLLKAKKELGLKLEIIEAKIKKLNQDYSDVVDTKAAVSASSTSEAPETSEPAEPEKVQAQMNKFDGVWVFVTSATKADSVCNANVDVTITKSKFSGALMLPKAPRFGKFSLSGSVDKDGKLIKLKAVGKSEFRFKGELGLNSGQGTWYELMNRCKGKWNANRE